jgi:hypothetical protein
MDKLSLEQLVASLGDGIADGYTLELGTYFEWSVDSPSVDGRYFVFAVNEGTDEEESMELELTWDQIRCLHAALTKTLLLHDC